MSHYDFRRLGEIVPDGKCDPRAIVPCDKIGLLGCKGFDFPENSKSLILKETPQNLRERLKGSLFLVKAVVSSPYKWTSNRD